MRKVMHAKCLTSIGRIKLECLTCEEIKVKVPHNPRGGGGGEDDPNPYDHDDGDGGPNWGRGRQDGIEARIVSAKRSPLRKM
eukprot:663322-Amphidinium_carterae.4